MDKYEVLGTLGEGSFGRVYQAKELCTGNFVALKVISKRGRSAKELKGFRRECEIQRDLHHPNIIQMLDSFETENEIVVITEFAHKELTKVLSKENYLPEDRVQLIVWDLVSALYYLHSNRVLHRDLKPQNILLDQKNRAKLCDFGFARNMSTGTHVLTSIKGTPLYMAPELIDEQPYDYTADLWSLGCIIYELLMGKPPFCTSSILHLIRMIRHEQIKWPTTESTTFLSENCISFLKGLLQKNPSKRLTWEEILNHPFIKGHILISKNTTPMPLTEPLTASVLEVKEKQRENSLTNKQLQISAIKAPETKNPSTSKSKEGLEKNYLHTENCNLKVSGEVRNETQTKSFELNDIERMNIKDKKNDCIKEQLSFIEDNHPIEAEEWIVFLQRSIQEVMSGEMTSLMQANLTNIVVSPLRNSNTSSKVLVFVAKLLSIPFVVKGTSENVTSQIKEVYLEVKLVPNLVYASKLLLRQQISDSNNSSSSPTLSLSPSPLVEQTYKDIHELNSEDLQALESIYLLICHLVHCQDEFLIQFCDSVVILNVYVLLNMFLTLGKIKLRLVLDVIAILTHMLRKLPENKEIIEKILFIDNTEPIKFVEILRHSDPILRERTCYFLFFIRKYFQEETVNAFWNDSLKETLEALMFDSIERVRNAAESIVTELKSKAL